MPKSFAVVDFINEEEVAVAPLSWLNDDKDLCIWPPLKEKEASKLAKQVAKPRSNWVTHKARVLGKFDTYNDARLQLPRATQESDLNSDAEVLGRGKRRTKPRNLFGDSPNVEEPLYEAPHTGNSGLFSQSTGINIPIVPEEVLQNFPGGVLQDVSLSLDTAAILEEKRQGEEEKASEELDLREAFKDLKRSNLMVIEHLKTIEANQNAIWEKLCSVNLESCQSASVAEVKYDFPINCLPLRTMSSVQEVEELLKDTRAVQCLTNNLALLGGGTLDHTVKKILRRLFDDAVAQHYSWVGGKGKNVFSMLKLSRIIFDAVRKNPELPDASLTDCQIEGRIKAWLKHAKARLRPGASALQRPLHTSPPPIPNSSTPTDETCPDQFRHRDFIPTTPIRRNTATSVSGRACLRMSDAMSRKNNTPPSPSLLKY